jgi:hypothetical protein
MEAGRASRPPAGGEYSGWAAFAGVMMVILGTLNALWGLAAIVNDEIVVVGGQGALIFDITTWGWIHLLLGLAVALVGFGLITGNAAARVAGIFIVALNAIAQIVWFPAAPLWSFLMVVIDIVIIYQLTMNWTADEARR